MQNITRALVLTLTLAGAAVSTNFASVSSHSAISNKLSAMPIPMCPPGDPAGCHIAGN